MGVIDWVGVSAIGLRAWLCVVAGFRVLSVYFGIFDVDKIRRHVFDRTAVTDVHGRTFAAWTTVSGLLAVATAYDLSNTTVYGVTLAAFAVAILHFSFDLWVGKSMSPRAAMSPMIIAGISVVWMAVGWRWYT